MKNALIIGQSPAAHAAVSQLLDRDPSISITLISTDGRLPYDRMLLPGLIDRSVKENDVFCAGEDFYTSARIQVMLGKEISRINFNRRRVFLAEKTQVDFDGLIITDGLQPRLPALKGIRRQGVFHLARLDTVRDLVRYLVFTETVCVEPVGFAGIKAALALKAVGKDVIVTMRSGALLEGVISAARAQALAQALAKRGLRVIPGGIEDVIGELEVKAVRLKSGKVVACDMVVIEDAAPDLKFLEDTGLNLGARILVADTFAASVPGVYAIDAAAQADSLAFTGSYWGDTSMGLAQASAAAAGLCGEERALTPADLVAPDMISTWFHPEELVAASAEVTA